jgi:hypothetical protein
VLTTDLPEDRLQTGDVGVVVEHYRPRGDAPEGYEVEFFSATGETVAVVSLPATSLRAAGATGSPERSRPGAGLKPNHQPAPEQGERGVLLRA